MTTKPDQCREAFEQRYPYAAFRDGEGYQDIRINGHVVKYLWEGWQSAWNAATVQPTDAPKQEAYYFGYDTGGKDISALCVRQGDRVVGIVHGELADAIKAALQSPAVPSWQPIETAPNDGTILLTYDSIREETHIAYLSYGCWNIVGAEDIEYRPTYWMPLPQPPEALALLGGKEE